MKPVTATMIIKNFAYSALTVAPKTLITLVNQDSAPHTATSRPAGAFDASVDGGSSTTFTAPAAAGTYNIICKVHSSMAGALTVRA